MKVKISQEYEKILKDLAATMLDVARESVILVKRSDQRQALKLTRNQEWDIYLEFLKVMFNLADRLSAFYIPIQTQPEFMDALEDAVSNRLKVVLAPTLSSSEIDDMEITLSIGQTVAESRQVYERFKFVVSEESKEKEAFFQLLGGQVATKAGAPTNQALKASADLCGRAVIPAMTALFKGTHPEGQEPTTSETSAAHVASASPSPPSSSTSKPQAIKLVRVLARCSGEEVEARWGVPPRFQRDLQPEEANELAKHMNRVTRILGERFAVLSSMTKTENQEHSGQA